MENDEFDLDISVLESGDGQATLINLTDDGRAFLAEYDPLVAELEEKMLAGMSDADRAAFREHLTACRHNLTE